MLLCTPRWRCYWEPLAVQALWQMLVKTCSKLARVGAPVLPGRAGSSMLDRILYRAPRHVIEDHVHIDVHLMLPRSAAPCQQRLTGCLTWTPAGMITGWYLVHLQHASLD